MARKKTKPASKPAGVTQSPPTAEVVTTLDGEQVPAAELAHLHPAIRCFAVRTASLTRDPDNARLHNERNLQAVANSLRKHGQQPSLLSFDPKTRVIKVGNGRHEVATGPKWGLNWTWIAAAPSNLSAAELKAFALADNRTAELADWNADVVERQIKELTAEFENFDAGEIGFDLRELDALLKGDVETAHGFTPPKPKKEKEKPAAADFAPKWLLIVQCTSERQQAELIEEFEKRGIEVTAPSA